MANQTKSPLLAKRYKDMTEKERDLVVQKLGGDILDQKRQFEEGEDREAFMKTAAGKNLSEALDHARYVSAFIGRRMQGVDADDDEKKQLAASLKVLGKL